MREISGEFLHAEIARLGDLVVQTWIHHASGVLLHSPGDVLTTAHAAVFDKAVLDRLLMVEASEDRRAALAAAGVTSVPLLDLTADDALAEDVLQPGGRGRYRAGTALEPAVVAAMTKDGIGSVSVCRGATAASLKWARTYLEMAPAQAPKPIRPDPVASALSTCAWSLLTPRAKLMLVIPDDFARLRAANLLLSAGHEIVEVKVFDEALAAAKSQHPDAVLVQPDGALQVCRELRKKGETLPSIVIAVIGEAAKLAGVAARAVAAGANDVVTMPTTPGLLADRVRAWLRLRGEVVVLAPSLVKDRRKAERRPATMSIRLSDPGASRTLPVTSGTLLDMSDGGLKLEYGLLEQPDPGTYRPGGVHPAHALFLYASDNPAGRDVFLTLTGMDSLPFESYARFTHITPAMGSERLGVAFVKKQEGAAERVTTVMRQRKQRI